MPPKIKTAVISEQAFVALVSSAVEVFDKETFGLMIGSQRGNKLHIKNALPYQNVQRGKDSVYYTEEQDKKVKQVLDDLTGYQVVGDFHSHPLWPNYLSDHDVAMMIDGSDHISALIVVEKFKKPVLWHYDRKDKALVGSLQDKWLVRIKVYKRDYGSRKIDKLKLDCPYIKKLS